MKRKVLLILQELKIQILLLIVALFFICKFSSATIMFPWMKFLLRPSEGTVSFEICRIMESLSLAYIASLIFYFIVDYIPKKKAEEKAFELLKPQLCSLFAGMNRINSYFKCVTNVFDFTTVSPEKIKEIDDFHFTNEKIYLIETYYKNGVVQNSDMVVFHGAKEIKSEGRLILNIFSDIDAVSSTMVQASSELITVLNKIRSSEFLEKIVKVFSEKEEIFNGEEIISMYFNFYRDLKDFSFFEEQLSKYNFEKRTVKYKKATEKEIKEWAYFQYNLRKEYPEMVQYVEKIKR